MSVEATSNCPDYYRTYYDLSSGHSSLLRAQTPFVSFVFTLLDCAKRHAHRARDAPRRQGQTGFARSGSIDVRQLLEEPALFMSHVQPSLAVLLFL